MDEPAAIDYDSTLTFFEGRAARSGGRPAVTVTSYQDHRPELAEERDRAEWERAEPLLGLDRRPRTLDVGCGVGRWARHLAGRVDSYLGIDFSLGLVELARTTIEEIGPTTDFRAEVGSAAQLGQLDVDGPFGLVIISGVLIYLNDDDVERCLDAVLTLLDDDSVLYLREPVAVASRLTLRNHWSDELDAEYHAIYRPASFYRDRVSHLLAAGFEVIHDEPIASHLQGRSETTQHFLVLRREARS